MTQEQKDLLRLQRIDALHEAEKITGNDYKTDKSTESLGFALHIQKGEAMRAYLAQIGDTQFSSTVKDYLHIVTNFGFKIVYTEPFHTERGEETLYVLFLKELGIILEFDTFTWSHGKEPNVNGGKMYYNWSPNTFHSRLTSSGHYYCVNRNNMKGTHIGLFEKDLSTKYTIPNYPKSLDWDGEIEWDEFKKLNDPIQQEQKELFELALKCGKRMLWIGDHDCREGIITTIKAMWENGKFFPIWQECPFPWITNYQEHKRDIKLPFTEYYEITQKRISLMPEDVRACINNTYKK